MKLTKAERNVFAKMGRRGAQKRKETLGAEGMRQWAKHANAVRWAKEREKVKASA